MNIVMRNLWEYEVWVDLDIENEHQKIQYYQQRHPKYQISIHFSWEKDYASEHNTRMMPESSWGSICDSFLFSRMIRIAAIFALE